MNDSRNKILRTMILRTMIFAIPSWIHGTVNGYVNYDCRCFPCCLAKSQHDVAYRARRRHEQRTA